MHELVYQRKLIKKIQDILPGCFIMKNDPSDVQGIPDILILFGNSWAMLEVKMEPDSNQQPNQTYYVDMFNQMSFAAFVNPDNEEMILDALQSTFRLNR